ncbi:MAG: hypothetical protein ACD_79C00108G0002 [uncultured bacterium]|nr:MAG: hypothetical protein ACD_79C00108G0002 [uncultured bacterium]
MIRLFNIILLISFIGLTSVFSADDTTSVISKYVGKYQIIEKSDNLPKIIGFFYNDVNRLVEYDENKNPIEIKIKEYTITGDGNPIVMYIPDVDLNIGWIEHQNFLEKNYERMDFDGKILSVKYAKKWFGVYVVKSSTSIDFSEYPVIEINKNGKKGKYKYFKEKPYEAVKIIKSKESEKKAVKPYSDNPITIG